MKKILLVEARFYENISDMLLEGAVEALSTYPDIHYEKISLPGAFEIPAAVQFAVASQQYDGFVALGCVIRGETTHYDYVCQESARGLMQLALQHNLAIGYGILTTENLTQAMVRADPKQKNKGRDAVIACLTMMALKEHFKVK